MNTNIFDGTQKLIGKGAQADVVLYQGYAYKIYRPAYPTEWIAFEKSQQNEVNKAGLSPVRYYDTEDDHIVKMDYVEGETLENRANRGDPTCLEILSKAFCFVHSKDASHINMPRLSDTAGMALTDSEKAIALPIVERLQNKLKPCVCHLDMHFLNIMTQEGNDEYTIIDWINARIAPAVFDYARTYTVFDEFSKEALEAYKAIVLPKMWESGISEEDFHDAVKVSKIIRDGEKRQ
ncbi:MAG: aminoglycoside phosphotransferase family protein [Lachnospiraceae bacterium]|nr:aminoglycoside phosphotransferase family protein [Lachnospiraceae bacterium]